MLSENDGKNRSQLTWARLEHFVDRFVRMRLYEHLHHGWPVDNVVNSLSLWIMWMTTTKGKLLFINLCPPHTCFQNNWPQNPSEVASISST
jgi:hypothetical protein